MSSGHYAVFFNVWRAEPVYHHPEGARVTETEPQHFEHRTRCGRPWWLTHDQRVRVHKDLFPQQHAVKFGRPCRLCFPSGPGEADA